MNVFDAYTLDEVKGFHASPPETWPDLFRRCIERHLANELLDAWLESHDDDEIEDRMRDVIESVTLPDDPAIDLT